MKPNKQLFSIALTIVLLALTLFFLRDFNIIFTEVDETEARVTVNFLLPMNQDKLADTIQIKSNKVYNNQFSSEIEWVGPHTCKIKLKESGPIRGQEVILIIKDAPTSYKGVNKNATIPIQFKSEVEIVQPTEEILVTTDKPFYVRFNTPMDERTLNKYLQSDAKFYIEAVKLQDEEGIEYIDETYFRFTPKAKLDNERKYLLSFRKGMPSKAGNLLKEPMQVVIQTDKLPIIERVIPADGSKWVGLYPRISVESKEPMVAAYMELDGEIIEGIKKSDYRMDFYPPYVLGADREYTASIQVQAPSGELSPKESLQFRTVPITKDRIWAEIILGKSHEMRVYQGEKELKRFACSGGEPGSPTPVGTYYLQSKGETYYDYKVNEGANYLIQLNEGIILHGMSRDPYWNLRTEVYSRLGEGQTKGKVIFKEEDALWLHEYLPEDAMIIIHP